MKKTIVSLLCCIGLASMLQADFLRVEMGAGGWTQQPSGDITYKENLLSGGKYTSNKKDDTGIYLWVLLKHPIPLIPNARLEYSSMDDKGKSKGTFEDFDTGNVATPSTLSVKEYDLIPYYNILDNTMWITLDLGIDLKVADTKFSADGVNINGFGIQDYTKTQTILIPLGYLRARVQIPSTGFGIETDIKYIAFDGSTALDNRIKIDYTFDFSSGIKPGIELGYRTKQYDLKSSDKKTKLNMDFKGVYAGLMLRF